ncbi:LacI family transcriptional regulator [Capsulimonas corticalis]|uniref:LacI family transcriptional regulator n=1 Tax=Capsulimonas corticalis TaxID=2219043 RepID=A0A402D6D5_9BACT|nr:LacI family DNA-binding transcriptional regulator [Capsulimonas corticalis]BDI32075.1 LacI family transcriptional regulator [Capsulimonas corticalis]
MNIIEFAKALNLSIGTVSRALNDRAQVSPKTRQFVLEKAEELGYVPNSNARSLVTGRNLMIRLVCSHLLSDLYLVELARGVEEVAGAHGYDLLLHLGTRRPNAAMGHGVDGLIVVAGQETTVEDLRRLTLHGRTPTVVIAGSEPLDFPEASYVCLDTFPGVREALAKLAALGHRRVGYIGSGQPGHVLSDAFPALMAEAGLTWYPELAREAGVTPDDGRLAALDLLTLMAPPTAIFARTDILASGAVQAVTQLGKTVPTDVSVIGHDNIEAAALVNPPLTTVAINIPNIADLAVRSLLAMIADKAAPTVQTVGTHLIERRSCGPAPA